MLQSAQMEIKLRFGDLERAAQASNRMADAQERTARATASASREQTTMLREAARGEASSRRMARRSISGAERELGSFIGGYRRDAVTEGREADRAAGRGGVGGFGGRLVGRLPIAQGLGVRVGESLNELKELGTPALAAGGALVGLALAAKTATNTLVEVGKARLESGGTAGQIAALSAMGIPVGEIAGRAAAFRQRIHSDPLAQASAIGAGLGAYAALPRALGPQNEAKAYQQALNSLKGITNAEERLRQARIWGMEADLQYIPVSQKVQDAMDEERRQREKLWGGTGTKDAMQAEQLAASEMRRFNDVLTALGRDALPLATAAIGQLHDMLPDASAGGWGALTGGGGKTSMFTDWSHFRYWLWGGDDPDASGQKKDDVDATAQNTAALNRLTTVMQEGVVGGGARSQGAFPPHWGGLYSALNSAASARRLGSFGEY